jgi:predicted NAD-dependent protein-ADP-ribosyltransferase YbiA (DUF1768 family)
MSEIHTQTGRTKLASLSNRWPCRVICQTREYVSGEHAFHGEKYFRLAQLSADTGRAKQLLEQAALFVGDNNTQTLAHTGGGSASFRLTKLERAAWSEISVYVQTEICRWKAAHCREVQEDLFVSGNRILVHLPKGTKPGFWDGVPVSGNIQVIGGNMLGYIWMDVRADRMAALDWAAEKY